MSNLNILESCNLALIAETLYKFLEPLRVDWDVLPFFVGIGAGHQQCDCSPPSFSCYVMALEFVGCLTIECYDNWYYIRYVSVASPGYQMLPKIEKKDLYMLYCYSMCMHTLTFTINNYYFWKDESSGLCHEHNVWLKHSCTTEDDILTSCIFQKLWTFDWKILHSKF